MYIARQLSFKGVQFRIQEAPLVKGFKKMYNECVELWMDAREMFEKAAELISVDNTRKTKIFSQFWSAHQRFFRYLCIAAKVKETVKLTHEALANGHCVVIGLQSTGEAGTLDLMEKEGELSDFVSTVKGTVSILRHFFMEILNYILT